jgi:hypothetical protein
MCEVVVMTHSFYADVCDIYVKKLFCFEMALACSNFTLCDV